MAAGTPMMSDDGGQPEGQGGVLGELDPAEDQAAGNGDFGGPPPDGPQTGQAATSPATIAGDEAEDQARRTGR